MTTPAHAAVLQRLSWLLRDAEVTDDDGKEATFIPVSLAGFRDTISQAIAALGMLGINGIAANLAEAHATLAAHLASSTTPASTGAGQWPAATDWPHKPFTVRDEPGEHDPCWLIFPGGEMLALNHHATNGVDQSRAQFIADACNAVVFGDRPSDDDLWEQTLRERDHYHEVADDLANAIAQHLGRDIGEHSSMNDPWQNALDAIDAAITQEPAQ